MKIVDVHCHVLPGVDDGSKNEEMSMDMIDIAYSQGIRTMILTPHYYLGHTKETGADFKKIFEVLRGKVQKKYPDYEMYLGNEVYWNKGVIGALKDQRINTMQGTKYVLVEFAPATSYSDIFEAIRMLTQAGYRPLVAHVERYHELTKHVDRVDEICKNGAVLQMNAGSLVGGMFDSHVKWCRKLMQEGYISMIGTDAHNTDDRAPFVKEALAWMEKKLDPDLMEDVLYRNAEKMLRNERIE